jgi:hypothetical protein
MLDADLKRGGLSIVWRKVKAVITPTPGTIDGMSALHSRQLRPRKRAPDVQLADLRQLDIEVFA